MSVFWHEHLSTRAFPLHGDVVSIIPSKFCRARQAFDFTTLLVRGLEVPCKIMLALNFAHSDEIIEVIVRIICNTRCGGPKRFTEMSQRARCIADF